MPHREAPMPCRYCRATPLIFRYAIAAVTRHCLRFSLSLLMLIIFAISFAAALFYATLICADVIREHAIISPCCRRRFYFMPLRRDAAVLARARCARHDAQRYVMRVR